MKDFRHLLIFDLREDFEECYIRDSFNVYEKTTNGKDNIIEDEIV